MTTIKAHLKSCVERGVASTVRFYAFPIVLVLCAIQVSLVGNPKWLVVTRLIIGAVSFVISSQETVRISLDRVRRRNGAVS